MIFNFLNILLYIIFLLFDIFVFSYISGINMREKNNYIFLLFVTIAVVIANYIGGFSSNLVSIFELVSFSIFYRKNGKFRVMIAILISLILDFLVDVILLILNYFTSNVILNIIVIFTLYLIIYKIISRYKKKIDEQIEGPNVKIFWGILLYLYSSMVAVNLVNLFIEQSAPSRLLFTILIIVQAVFIFVVYFEIIKEQHEQGKLRQYRLSLRKQKQLQEYADYLEKSEDDLRAFRHDYRNILNSLKISAQEGNVQEVIQKLDKYTKTNLNSQALLKYKDVNHIQVKSLKSIIITKLAEMYSLQIPYNFECRDDILQITDKIDELDLVRIIGITIDNAIEESKAIQKSAGDAEVQIMIYSSNPSEFEYEIRNKIRDRQISTSQIQKRGFTTKKDHQGLGLANIREMEEKYPNLSVSYAVEDGWFDFYMTIDGDEVNENDG